MDAAAVREGALEAECMAVLDRCIDRARVPVVVASHVLQLTSAVGPDNGFADMYTRDTGHIGKTGGAIAREKIDGPKFSPRKNQHRGRWLTLPPTVPKLRISGEAMLTGAWPNSGTLVVSSWCSTRSVRV